jgi:hypothetical protein
MLQRSAPPPTRTEDERRFVNPSRTPPASTEPASGSEERDDDVDASPVSAPGGAGWAPGARDLQQGGGWAAPAERWAPSPSLGRRELAWAVLGGVLLAVITSWPLVLHLPSRIAPDLGDPVRTAWQVAWVGHAMLHDPLHIFDSNAFHPHSLSLAFATTSCSCSRGRCASWAPTCSRASWA